MTVSLILAMSENRVIGKNGRLPWYIPEDFEWFRRQTSGHPVIMGRKTFESIGKVLPGRTNIIITTRADYMVEGACVCSSLDRALERASETGTDETFIIGGSSIFEQGLGSADRIYLTLIHAHIDGDSFFPALEGGAFRTVFEEPHEEKTLETARPWNGSGGNRWDTRPPFTFYILERRGDMQAGPVQRESE